MRDSHDHPPPLATLHVCLTCRSEGADPDAPRAGAALHAALADALADDAALRIVGVECLSNCRRACTVALSGPGRWTYVYGDLSPLDDVAAICDGARRYVAAADGLVPWRERPERFRKGVIARVPPLEPSVETV
jgi:predicted metal-binding protein